MSDLGTGWGKSAGWGEAVIVQPLSDKTLGVGMKARLQVQWLLSHVWVCGTRDTKRRWRQHRSEPNTQTEQLQ